MDLWGKDSEIQFFRESLKEHRPSDLFYETAVGDLYAYWPRSYKGKRSTLQSRNSIIGNFTESWIQNLLNPIAQAHGLHAVKDLVCPELGLPPRSPADLAFTTTQASQTPAGNVKLIIEVKMSVVWNWMLRGGEEGYSLECVGDFTTHSGNPGLLRSDSMLKAIGKSINIRTSGEDASEIPIIIIGNTPITNHYHQKVDQLKKAGIIQCFLSVNPNPRDGQSQALKKTKLGGFKRIDSISELQSKFEELLSSNIRFFSGMMSLNSLGSIITKSSMGSTLEEKGEIFLGLI